MSVSDSNSTGHSSGVSPIKTDQLQVIVVEDDALILAALKIALKSHRLQNYTTIHDLLDSGDVPARADLVLLDLCHPGDREGTQTIARISELKQSLPNAEIIIQSGVNDVAMMRACVRAGAAQFLLKEHVSSELPLILARSLEQASQRAGVDALLVGQSVAMKKLKRELLFLRNQSASDVLIEGETGTGKELCAQVLHNDGPLVAVNAAAIPAELFEAEFFGAEKGSFTGSAGPRAGHFETTGNGTLFLDEVQSLPLAQQAKLLRVLETRSFLRVGSSQERKFKGRIVAASNLNLREAVERGTFREDLYYRLASSIVRVPPLRVRGGDIAMLAQFFLESFDTRKRLSFSVAAMDFFCTGYDWPGNVREMRGLIKSLAMKSHIPVIDVPEILDILKPTEDNLEIAPAAATSNEAMAADWNLGFDENVARFEKHLLSLALSKKGGSAEARDLLKLSRSRFYEKIKEYQLGK